MAEKKQFKAESQRLLDLMINSIYTHREIFLRELISNASDANDKLYYKALTENISDIAKENLAIELSFDKEKRTITLKDSGIGMNRDDLEKNLGTIASSDSFAFKAENDKENEDIDIIGQFGVGFYAAFMVAKKVEVTSKKYGEDQGYTWVSEVIDGYEIFETNVPQNGTTITLYLKDNTEDENFDEYLDQYKLESLVKKYSDYVRYPIKMEVTTSKLKEGTESEYEDVTEMKTLNSMVPLWKRSKSDITESEYSEFYQDKFHDYNEPLKVIHTSVEGNISYTGLFFIPSKPPMNYFSNDYEKGLQLYSRGVFIMDKASDLVPEHFRFVKGLVDSQDLNLNISREILQQDRQMKSIATSVERKIQRELETMLKKEREDYEKFFESFGVQLKFGIYNSYGMLKDKLQDLLLFHSAKLDKMVTLKEYVEAMGEDQKDIYFASGESNEKIARLPQVELVLDKGYDVLYLTDNVDEFTLQMMMNYDEKTFKNVQAGDLDLETEAEKAELEEKTKENTDMLSALKDALADKVEDVKISARLKSHPVCIVSSDGVSFEMEKVLAQMPNEGNENVKAKRILEINPNHGIFAALQSVYAKNPAKVSDYASLLYDQALLIEGFTLEDPVEFSNRICELMVEANK